MGLPRHSVTGLSIIDCAAFGRNIQTLNSSIKANINEGLEIGSLQHMHKTEETKIILDKNSLSSHTFISGSTGTGKTTAIFSLLEKILQKKNNQIHFLVIEPSKGEYKHRFSNNKSVTVYGTNPKITKLLRINPFSFNENVHILEHIDRLIEIFNACWPMYAAMPEVLKEAIQRAYTDIGWSLEQSDFNNENQFGKQYPCFADVLEQINNVITGSKYSSDTKGDYIGALTMRVGSLAKGMYGQILTNSELLDNELFDKNVIVDLSRISSSETKALIMGILVMKLQEYRLSTNQGFNQNLKHITVLEEAHNLLRKTNLEQTSEFSNLMGKSVEMLANSIAEMRSFGEGFIIADQSPGLLDMSAIRNTNTKLIFRLPDYSDRKLVGQSANLNEQQIVELARLETGVCGVYQNDWLEPVLCHISLNNENNNSYINKNDEPKQSILQTKNEILKFVLSSRNIKIESDLEDLKIKANKLPLSTKLKMKIINYISETDINEISKQRNEIVYELLKPEEILNKNKKYSSDISEWTNNMLKDLNIDNINFNETEINKILGILSIEETKRNADYFELADSFVNSIK